MGVWETMFLIDLPETAEVADGVTFGLNGELVGSLVASDTVVSHPVVYQPLRQVGKSTIKTNNAEGQLQSVIVSDGVDSINLQGQSLNMFIEFRNGTDAATPDVTGTEFGFAFTIPNIEPADYVWSVRKDGTGEVVASGEYVVEYAAV